MSKAVDYVLFQTHKVQSHGPQVIGFNIGKSTTSRQNFIWIPAKSRFETRSPASTEARHRLRSALNSTQGNTPVTSGLASTYQVFPGSQNYRGIKADLWSQCPINRVLLQAAEAYYRLPAATAGWLRVSHGFSHLRPTVLVYWTRPSGIKCARSAQSQCNLNVSVPPFDQYTPVCRD